MLPFCHHRSSKIQILSCQLEIPQSMSGAILRERIYLDTYPCLCLMLEFKLSTLEWTL